MIAFLAAATWQESLQWRIDWLEQQRNFYRRMVARCDRIWKDLPAMFAESQSARFESELTRDLDLFGDRSLFRWLSLAATSSGAVKLATWMTCWERAEVICERQTAVRELQRSRDWRQQFWDASLAFQGGHTNPESIALWGAGRSFYHDRPWLTWMTWLGPIVATLGLFAIAMGIMIGWTEVAVAGAGPSSSCIAVELAVNSNHHEPSARYIRADRWGESRTPSPVGPHSVDRAT